MEHVPVEFKGFLVIIIPLLGLLSATGCGVVVEEGVREKDAHVEAIVVHERHMKVPNMIDLLGWSEHFVATDGHQHKFFVLKDISIC